MKFIKIITAAIALVLLLIINIRVEADAASTFEHSLDGLFAGATLITLVFLAVSFYLNK